MKKILEINICSLLLIVSFIESVWIFIYAFAFADAWPLRIFFVFCYFVWAYITLGIVEKLRKVAK